MDVSIIIVNWNTCEILRNCLQSIYDQTSDVQFEVIVIDNASSDGSAEMIRTDFPKIKLMENNENGVLLLQTIKASKLLQDVIYYY